MRSRGKRAVSAGIVALAFSATAAGCAAPNLPDVVFPTPGPTTSLSVPWAGGGCPDRFLGELQRLGGSDMSYIGVTQSEVHYPGPSSDLAGGCFVSIVTKQTDSGFAQYLGVVPARPEFVARFEAAMIAAGYSRDEGADLDAYSKDQEYWSVSAHPDEQVPADSSPFTGSFSGAIILLVHATFTSEG